MYEAYSTVQRTHKDEQYKLLLLCTVLHSSIIELSERANGWLKKEEFYYRGLVFEFMHAEWRPGPLIQNAMLYYAL